MRFAFACSFLFATAQAFSVVQPVAPTRSAVLGANSANEDLELTRQIILGHITGGVSGVVVEEDDEDFYRPPVSQVDRPDNDLMIRAAFGEPVERTPVWLFRQAGRHLPEYHSYKRIQDKNFLELLAEPACVAECTLQPVRRYPLDAAILFSDILVIPEALGIEVTMPGGVGIQVPNPLNNAGEVASRLPSVRDSKEAGDLVQDKLSHVLAAVRQIRAQMAKEDISIPLIGFSAAPYTLLYYMVGGSSKKNTDSGVRWLTNHPEESQELLDILTRMVIEYVSAQVDAGCHMLQIFEAMGMMIDDENFEKFAMPAMEKIATEIKARHPDVPLMVFARGASSMNGKLAELGLFDVITIDGTVDRSVARDIGSNVSLQGNYDPAELVLSKGGTVDSVRASAKKLLEELGPQRLIANLGEGLGGKESPLLVKTFIDAIHEESEAMLSNQ